MISPATATDAICFCHRDTEKKGRVLSPTWMSVLITSPPFDSLYCTQQLITKFWRKFLQITHTHTLHIDRERPEQAWTVEREREAERNRRRGERRWRGRLEARTIRLLTSLLYRPRESSLLFIFWRENSRSGFCDWAFSCRSKPKTLPRLV
jgi:hypothetical protein